MFFSCSPCSWFVAAVFFHVHVVVFMMFLQHAQISIFLFLGGFRSSPVIQWVSDGVFEYQTPNQWHYGLLLAEPCATITPKQIGTNKKVTKRNSKNKQHKKRSQETLPKGTTKNDDTVAKPKQTTPVPEINQSGKFLVVAVFCCFFFVPWVVFSVLLLLIFGGGCFVLLRGGVPSAVFLNHFFVESS